MKRLGYTLAWIIWLALLIWGIWGVVMRFTHGHELANYGSYVPWGLWVSAYIYFLGLSEGLFFTAALAYVFKVKALEPVGRLALFGAVVMLGVGLACVWFDLGHMWRAWELMIWPDFSSLMAWMVWAYNLYAVLVLLMLWFEIRCDLARWAEHGGISGAVCRVLALGWKCPEDEQALVACHARSRTVMRVLGAITLVIAVMAAGGVGALFATLSGRPYWHTGLFPILFMVGDQVVGLALLLALAAACNVVKPEHRLGVLRWMGWLMVILIGLDLLLEWAEFSTPLWYGIGADADLSREVLFGEFWWTFWLLHVGLGSLVPVVLLLMRPIRRWAYALAGALVLVTFMTVRLNIVIPGQVQPALRGLADAYQGPRLQFEYVPSAFEWSVVAFAAAMATALVYLGRKLLPIADVDVETVWSQKP